MNFDKIYKASNRGNTPDDSTKKTGIEWCERVYSNSNKPEKMDSIKKRFTESHHR